jgi:hypothetical protein
LFITPGLIFVGGRTSKHQRSRRRPLLDHLVGGGQQRLRDGKAERLGGLEIDDEINFRNLLDRQIGRFFAFENAPGIDANLVVEIAEAAAIRDSLFALEQFPRGLGIFLRGLPLLPNENGISCKLAPTFTCRRSVQRPPLNCASNVRCWRGSWTSSMIVPSSNPFETVGTTLRCWTFFALPFSTPKS